MRFAWGASILLLVAGCQSPAEEPGDCTRTAGESGIEISCGATADSQWEDDTLEETREDMERRTPGGRTQVP